MAAHRRALAVVVTALALLPAACSSDDGGGGSTTAAGNSPRPCDTSPHADDVYAGFPVAEVPVLDGEVADTWNGRDNGEYGCSVEVDREEDAAPALTAAVDLLVDAGFTVVYDDLEDETSPFARLTAEDYRIGVSALQNYGEPGSSVSYDLRGPYLEESYDDAGESDAALPSGFPADEVPLTEGRVVSAETSEDYRGMPSHTIVVRTERTATESGEDAVSLLEEAGFEVLEPLTVEVGSGSAVLVTDTLEVRLLVSEDKEEQTVTVTYDVGEPE